MHITGSGLCILQKTLVNSVTKENTQVVALLLIKSCSFVHLVVDW